MKSTPCKTHTMLLDVVPNENMMVSHAEHQLCSMEDADYTEENQLVH